MTTTSHVTVHNFAQCSDDQIIADARAVIATLPNPKPVLRRLLRTRNPDVMVAGKFLWGHLTTKKVPAHQA